MCLNGLNGDMIMNKRVSVVTSMKCGVFVFSGTIRTGVDTYIVRWVS